MTVRRKALKTLRHFDLPVSYRVLDGEFLTDSRNVFTNNGVCETRYGLKRYNPTSLGGPVLSLSYFQHSDGTRYKLAKVGTVLYSVTATTATAIKTGLTATTKHRAVTVNNRHIIAIESDGLFSYNGTIFTQLGQSPPSAGLAAVSAGGTLDASTNYQVGLTFYSSSTGFESNVYGLTYVTTTAGNKQIDITAIPATATNTTIDKVRVYLKNMGTAVQSNNAYLFVTELNLGTTTYTITTPTISTIVPPTKNAPPLSGGAKYIALFGKKIAIAGNSNYPSEVFFSEEYLPDAFDDNASTQVIVQVPGQGPITGLGVGMYDQSFLNPYVAIFKKSATAIYSELSNLPNLAFIDSRIGCVSHDTIRVHNSFIYFLSEMGWRTIVNGTMIKNSKNESVTMGDGRIDDVFTRPGWAYELNMQNTTNFFSVFYPIDSHYLTFVSESGSTEIRKAYNYEEKIGGFRPFEFSEILTAGVEGEDDNGYQTIFLSNNTGVIYTYSARNSRHDEDLAGTSIKISTYVVMPYMIPGDDSCTYNFRTLAVRALGSANAITVNVYPRFSMSTYDTHTYDFSDYDPGFVLDVSQLDIDAFGDERAPVTYMADLNKTGEALLIKFSQDILDANIGIISAQLTLNKNGGRNL
jgi:hypothetical protein